MLIGSLCDSGSTHSVGLREYIYQMNFIVVKFHFLFRNKLILILIYPKDIASLTNYMQLDLNHPYSING